MSYSRENISRRNVLKLAALLPIAAINSACNIVDTKPPQSALIYSLSDSKGEETYHILYDRNAPSEYSIAADAILCHRSKGKPLGLFPNRVQEKRVVKQCESIQAVRMRQEPKKGEPLIEGVTYDIIGPSQSLPLSK